jgi:hypothetical protein
VRRTAEVDGRCSFGERGTARHVELLKGVDEFESVALARGPDTLGLFGGNDEPFAVTGADAGDADLELESDEGQTVRLSELRGKPVVLYFYPKDHTAASI